jgi:hypothetical protein
MDTKKNRSFVKWCGFFYFCTMISTRRNLFIALLFSNFHLFAQLSETEQSYFRSREDSLKPMARQVLYATGESGRKAANAHFIELLEHTLQENKSFYYNFDSLTTIARFSAPDGSFHLYNWELRNDDGTYEYYGFIQKREKKGKAVKVYPLVDKSLGIKKPEIAALDPNNWWGTHYYKMVPVKKKRKHYYILLGIDWNDKLTHKKILDILYFTANGRPKFGDAILKVGEMRGHPVIQRRFILEYSSEVTASLRYDEKRNIFIFDHLVPQQENLKGQYQFYGPDLSFDGFELKKGAWQYIEDIDARNEKNPRDKNYHQPK